MIKIVFALTLLVSSTMFARDKYDIFIDKMKIENVAKDFVNNYIDKLATASNGITAAQWATIKTKIDYSPYFLGIKSVLMRNYTTRELDEIIQANDIVSPVNDTGQFIFKPKEVVQTQFYNISRIFGK